MPQDLKLEDYQMSRNNVIGKSVESLTEVGRTGRIEAVDMYSGRPIVLWNGEIKND